MKTKNSTKEILKLKKTIKGMWYVIVGVVVFVVFLIFIFALVDNGDDNVVCYSPYIQVGEGCCLDTNSNSICDNEEVIEEEKNLWELDGFNMDGGIAEDFMICYEGGGGTVYNFNSKYLRNIVIKNIEMSLKKYDMTDYTKSVIYEHNNYENAVLIVYTDYDLNFYDEYEGVTCEVEEHYDGDFNEVSTKKFGYVSKGAYGFSITIWYEVEKKPSEAKYVISCKGDESGKEFKRTFKFNINYVEKLGTLVC